MKKISSFLLVLVTALCLVACSDSPDSLGKSTAKKIFKKEMTRLHKLDGSAVIQTGYYECNDDDARYKLRQLAANEIVTYKCDVVKKKERVKKTRRVQAGYWYRYWTTESYYVTEEVDRYFVTVALTDKGRALIYEEPEIEPDEDAKDMNLDEELDLSKYPEFNVNPEEFPVPGADTDYAEVEQEVAGDSVGEVDSVAVAEDAVEAAPEPVDPNMSEYDKAKAKENYEVVTLKAYSIDIIKARNVRKDGDFTAQAEIVMEYENVTPVGRIMLSVYEGQRFLSGTLHYVYYEDKGWRLNAGD